jgi:hypothetical protein
MWQRMHANELGSVPMHDDLRGDFSKIAAVTLKKTAKLCDCSEWYIRKLIKEGQLDSDLDGGIRKVPLRSIEERQERLLKAQNPSPTIPPPPDHAKIAKARAEKRAQMRPATPSSPTLLPLPDHAKLANVRAEARARVGPATTSRQHKQPENTTTA